MVDDHTIDAVLDALRSTANGGAKTGRLIAARAAETIEELQQKTEQQRKVAEIHSGAHQLCADRFIGMGQAVMTKVADGGSLAEVLDIVGDWMTGCDAWDDELGALFDRAKAAAR